MQTSVTIISPGTWSFTALTARCTMPFGSKPELPRSSFRSGMPNRMMAEIPKAATSLASFTKRSTESLNWPGIEAISSRRSRPSTTNSGKIKSDGARLVSRTMRRNASCCRNRRSRCIGKAIGSLPRKIRQKHYDVAHRYHADEFPILSHTKMADMRFGHQIIRIQYGLIPFDQHDWSRHNLFGRCLAHVNSGRDHAPDHIGIREDADDLLAIRHEQAADTPIAHNPCRCLCIRIPLNGNKLLLRNHE